MLYRQSSQQIRTPQIALMQMMPMTLPSVENWKLQLLCQMRFVNGGDRNFTLSSFLGDFEYQDLTGLGVFELQPEDVPFTLRPQETKYVLARLTMHDHLPHIKARLTTGLIAEWIGKKNPVLKLRTQTIGLVWAWDTMVQFQAEYLCRYTLYVAKHGLGLVDFSNWTLAQERWQDALSKGQAKADEGLVAFERTKVDGEILDPLYFFAGVATACMVCICLICCCASCYPCYFPAQHGSTSEWTSLALVICFGNRILAWQPESQPLQSTSKAKDAASGMQPDPSTGGNFSFGMGTAADYPPPGMGAPTGMYAPGMYAAPGIGQASITPAWLAGAPLPVHGMEPDRMASPYTGAAAYGMVPAPGKGPEGTVAPGGGFADPYMSPPAGMGSAGMMAPQMHLGDPTLGVADAGMPPLPGIDLAGNAIAPAIKFGGNPHGRWSAATRFEGGKGPIHMEIGRPDVLARE